VHRSAVRVAPRVRAADRHLAVADRAVDVREPALLVVDVAVRHDHPGTGEVSCSRGEAAAGGGHPADPVRVGDEADGRRGTDGGRSRLCSLALTSRASGWSRSVVPVTEAAP
jgi:hypothetical protein